MSEGLQSELLVRLARIESAVQRIERTLAGFHAEPYRLPHPGEMTVGWPLPQSPTAETLTVSAESPCQCPQCRATIAVLTERGALCPGCANNS